MKALAIGAVLLATCAVASTPAAAQAPGATPVLASGSWDPRAAAAYLDGRQSWWQSWPNAARDHDTQCVSCHTAMPYALARASLRAELREREQPAPERKLLDNVVKRVRLWKDVEPFYPDQKDGLPKTSESRGTEAILNALILSSRDAELASASDDARMAFDNLWALQFRTGDLSGAWAWLNFHLEPWESGDAAYFGASLAAIAIGTEPGGYAASPDIQDRLKKLREFLQRGIATTPLFNRVMLVWASARLPGVLSAPERQAIVDAVWSTQNADGGWSLMSLGQFKRSDGTVLDAGSDGYATGVVAFALLQAGHSRTEPHVAKALEWLVQHQDRATGMWLSSSLNKQRDPASDRGKFMSDAATAYAVLALTHGR